jgi:hypothetical protein
MHDQQEYLRNIEHLWTLLEGGPVKDSTQTIYGGRSVPTRAFGD